MAKILFIEDDKRLCTTLQDFFEFKNYSVELAHNSNDGLAILSCADFDVVILDVNLPGGMSGFELCKLYRERGGKAPIIMLTGQDQLIDKETGFNVGADDYLCKPFHIEELSLRVQALLRRTSRSFENVLRGGELMLNPSTYSVLRGHVRLELSRVEFALLEFLMRHPKQVFSPETLLSHVWKSGSETSPETVRTFVKRLRSKIDVAGKLSFIRNFHGVGYCFDAERA